MTKIFKTTDLALAATLCLQEISYSGVEETDERNRVQFIFKEGVKAEKLSNDFMDKKILVEPREYFLKLKELKSDIYYLLKP